MGEPHGGRVAKGGQKQRDCVKTAQAAVVGGVAPAEVAHAAAPALSARLARAELNSSRQNSGRSLTR